jgi:hypothetical protein
VEVTVDEDLVGEDVLIPDGDSVRFVDPMVGAVVDAADGRVEGTDV